MLSRIRPLLVLVGAILIGLALGCAGTGVNKGDLNLISLDEEWALGDKLAADIAKEARIISDPAVKAYITMMGEKILAQVKDQSDAARRPWSFDVIDDPQVNAFNIPGGRVYFYSGLLARAESYGEVMGVMGHEVSHGLARHGTENMSKQYGIALVAGLVLGKDPSMYQQLLANVLANGTIMKFSRDAENEADCLGARFVYDAGVDPRGMVSFFRTLMSMRASRPGAIERFFASHPLTEDRIQNVSAMIEAFPPKPLVSDDAGFAAFRAQVARAATKQ